MNAQPSTIAELFDAQNVPYENRTRLLTLALARALAYALPIPVTAVADPYIHFTTELKMEVDRTAAVFNERIVLSLDAVAETTRRLWLCRYRLVHQANSSAVRQFLDAMVRVGSPTVPPEVSALLVETDSVLLDQAASILSDQFGVVDNG